jgi:hypothetical protein
MDTNKEITAAGETTTTVQSGANGSPAAASSTPSGTPARDEKTLDAISSGLADLFDSDSSDETAEAEQEGTTNAGETSATEATETPAPEQEEKPEDGEQATEGDDTNKPGAAAAKPATKAGDDAPTLPDAYVRSLKSRGWTDEKIAADYTKFGLDFVDLAERIHKSRNSEVAEWAAAGRNAIAQQQQATPPQQQQQRQAETPAGLKPVDVAKLKEKYGEDEAMIDDIVGPVNQAIEHINRMLPQIQQTQQRSQQAELDMLEKQVGSFFGGKELEPYRTVYGDSATAVLNKDQIVARNKVLETANALIVGAKVQHRDLSLGEALQFAHDAVSGDFKEQAVRTTIKKELKQRKQGISLKPTARGNNGQFKGGSGKTDRERSVAAGLKAAFG